MHVAGVVEEDQVARWKAKKRKEENNDIKTPFKSSLSLLLYPRIDVDVKVGNRSQAAGGQRQWNQARGGVQGDGGEQADEPPVPTANEVDDEKGDQIQLKVGAHVPGVRAALQKKTETVRFLNKNTLSQKRTRWSMGRKLCTRSRWYQKCVRQGST